MIKLFKPKESNKKCPPSKSKGIFSDIYYFFWKKPQESTLIKFKSKKERFEYSQRIMQRLGVDVNEYGILNIHKIGINAPVKYVFEELLKWNGDSSCWPNNIATVERINNRLEKIRIFLFGIRKYPFGIKNGFFGFKFIPLFNLSSIKFQQFPDNVDFDNARYLLYKCSGGYPVGVFSMYVRSPINEQKEVEPTQLFLLVGFNFYGKKDWTKRNFINKIWECIHDRVTSNTVSRFKQLCEWKFEKIRHKLEN